MKPTQWDTIRYFDPSENWGAPNKMDYKLIIELDRLRQYIGQKIIIHCGYEPRDGAGYHPKGLAVDCHAEKMHPIEFFIAATRFDFGGIGVYLWWSNPGLHLDKRPVRARAHRSIWGSTAPKVYVSLDRAFLQQAATI
jgi:uncharacterized protein YcbK (DUF882 family)